MARPLKRQRCSAAKDQKNLSEIAATDDTTLPSTPKGLLDLPPELRNTIYRYVMIGDEPIKIQYEDNRVTVSSHFTMIPALTLVSKQLRAETQRMFFEGNEFEIRLQIFKRKGVVPLLELRRLHKKVGLESPSTLHVHYEVKKRCYGDLYLFTANLTLSIVEGHVEIIKETYGSEHIGRSLEYSPLVCGCRVHKIILSINARCKTRDLVLFLQQAHALLRGRQSYHYADTSSTDEVSGADGCDKCPRDTYTWRCVLF